VRGIRTYPESAGDLNDGGLDGRTILLPKGEGSQHREEEGEKKGWAVHLVYLSTLSARV
jgi:hypothetical protein